MQLATAPHHDWPAAPIVDARPNASRLELVWSTGHTQSLPLIWLRDNCVCSECRIAATGEHRYFLGRVDSLPAPTLVGVTNGVIEISWTDGHTSAFTNDDFVRLLHIADRHHVPARVWGDDYEPERFNRDDILHDTTTRLEFLTVAMRDGMAIVTDMPNKSGECIRFLEAIKLPIRDTAFDRLHDVFLRTDAYNVAHTAEALPPHNDFASYTWPPSGQLIHMLINEVKGGEWVNVDGFKVLAQLYRTNPQAVQVLSQVPVAFREHADYAESWTRAPIVRVDSRGNIVGMRFSNQLMQPMSPFEPQVEEFYEAYHLLSRAVNDPANQIAFRGHAGTMQFLHGHRVLHSRRAFDASSGSRHLQDTYFDFDDVASLVALTSGQAR